jgi:translation elongation factor EF-Tu-like GTPase
MAHVEIELTLLPKGHGGRSTPAGQGYRPQFYYGNGDWDASYEYDVEGEVPLGRLVRARLTFLSPGEHRGKVFVGMPFLMREGARTVGYGRITALLGLDSPSAS